MAQPQCYLLPEAFQDHPPTISQQAPVILRLPLLLRVGHVFILLFICLLVPPTHTQMSSP